MPPFNLVILAISSVAAMSVLMLLAHFAQMRLGNAGWTDAFWSLSVGLVGASGALVPLSDAPADPVRQIAVALFALVWSVRLGGHIARRTRGAPEDRRYARIRREQGANFGRAMLVFLQIQALCGAVFAFALALVAHAPHRLGGALDAAGLGVMILGFAIESLADAQLEAFRKAAPRGSVCDSGLWGLTRHPNYLGEWLFWCGLALCAQSAGYGAGLLALFAPVFSYWLLRHVSGVPLLEAEMLESRGRAYVDYQSRVGAFFPRPPFSRERPQR